MTQRTLLESNFWSRSKFQSSSFGLERLESNAFGRGLDDNLVQSAVHQLPHLGATEENNINICKSSTKSEPVVQTHIDGPSENLVNVDWPNYNTDTTLHLSPKNEVAKSEVDVTVDDVSGVKLETFIVGRKFSDEENLHTGARISLLRDPDNGKDPNAIKVGPFPLLLP